MVYFLHQAFFARYSWEARWQGKALNSPCADSREAMNKQCRSFTLFLELLQELLAHLAPFAYLGGVMCYTRVYLLTEQVWPQCPEKTGLCSEPLLPPV